MQYKKGLIQMAITVKYIYIPQTWNDLSNHKILHNANIKYWQKKPLNTADCYNKKKIVQKKKNLSSQEKKLVKKKRYFI